MNSKENRKEEIHSHTFSPTLIILCCLVFLGGLAGFLLHTNNQKVVKNVPSFMLSQGSFLVPLSNPKNPPLKVVRTMRTIVTAYSSTPGQTDDSPFITASNQKVRDGIVANNSLPFGTEIRIPELYGDKVFVVEDRMSRKKSNYHFDVWFSNYEKARAFGAERTYIEVLGR